MKRSFILHLADGNETELMIASDAFGYATCNDYKETVVVLIDSEEFIVIESLKEVQRLYEETEG